MADLYEYYATHNIRPTFADFDDDAELSKYEKLRKNVFFRLMFPSATFSGKRVLEFGPDTGENSLVFARWGAHLTLVEPNVEAHSYIRRYFSKFKMDACLDDIIDESLLTFGRVPKFDIIDAEGFIYTIKPNSAWINKTADCLESEGYLIINYMELYGGFMELLLKAIYNRVMIDPSYGPGIETAKQLFLPKWDSISHTRRIESWFMDVIENPFVRMKYFIDSVDLLKDTHAGGFRLYSSWPNYKNMLDVRWIKASVDQENDLCESVSFVEQSRLSHLLSCKCFVSEPLRELNDNLAMLVQLTDGLIDLWSQEVCVTAVKCVGNIENLLKGMSVVSGDHDSLSPRRILYMIKSVFQLMEVDGADRLVEFCRNDKTFISTWGTPAHYAIFQLMASAS